VSELPSSALDYGAVVAEYFLALRGVGLLLSPLDEELVAEWERRGIPVAVVCRGIRAGLEQLASAGARRPRSLRAVRLAVDDAWRAYRSGRVGEAPAPPGEAEVAGRWLREARARIEEAGRACADELRAGYRAAWRAIAAEAGFPGSPLERAEAALAAADAHLVRAWVSSLGREARAALGRRVRLLAGARSAWTSRRAHRDALRAHVVDAARAAGLTSLRGSV
jgi:hypothetical protein